MKITLRQPLSPVLLSQVANYSGGFIVCQQGRQALWAKLFRRRSRSAIGLFMFDSYTPQEGQPRSQSRLLPLAPKLPVSICATSPTSPAVRQACWRASDVNQRHPGHRLGSTAWRAGLRRRSTSSASARFSHRSLQHHEEAAGQSRRVRKALALRPGRDEFLASSANQTAENVRPCRPEFLAGGLTRKS